MMSGTQTLMRGLDVIEGGTAGALTLPQFSEALGLTRSTTYRIATSLVERSYLRFSPREGYRLGPKLLALGHFAQEQADIIGMLGHAPQFWSERFIFENADRKSHSCFDLWRERMVDYVRTGRALDLEENQDQIRCVAAPLRDARAGIVGAISVSSAALYMSYDRMDDLSNIVLATAHATSRLHQLQ